MKKVNHVIWGVIGAGSVCEVKSVPAMYKVNHSEVKAVMRRNGEKAADFAVRHDIPYATTNVDDLLNDPDINIIYVATPPDTHCEYTLRVAAAGKAVYVEKPMANSTEECQRMIDACEKAGVPLFVAYYRRRLPGFLKLKELLDAGIIGDVRFVDIEMYRYPRPNDFTLENNWRVLPEVAGGGHFHDLASHQLDALDFIFGKITHVAGFSRNQARLYPADDIVTGSFEFENGVIGSGVWCFTADKSAEREISTIVGSKGHLTFTTFDNPMIIEVTTESGTEILSIEHPLHIQQPLVQTIVDEMRGDGTCPSKGETGIRTTWAMEQFKK